jgi:hypothetical protein
VPGRISRRQFSGNLDDYYGQGKSILLNVGGSDILPDPHIPGQQLSDLIKVCDLSGWKHDTSDKIAIDPVLGRVMFPSPQAEPPLLTSYYGFSAKMGGGEYGRVASFDAQLRPDQKTAPDVEVIRVARNGAQHYSSIQEALDHLTRPLAIIEITDSGPYKEKISIDATNRRIELRAADQRRPTLMLNGELQITGGDQDTVSLNGLLMTGGQLRVSGGLGHFHLRHCTLVPAGDSNPSLTVESESAAVEIDQSILGGVRAIADSRIQIMNSIVDATGATGLAYTGSDGKSPGGALHIENSTVIGKVRALVMEMASNTIFVSRLSGSDDPKEWPASVQVTRRQEGCVRFSFLPLEARVPRRYRCQPGPESDASRVRPVFTSLTYGDPGYCQLRPECPLEIWRGADDQSEMGVFHNLYEPQRAAHLRARLDEYLRFGLEAGIFYAN